MSTSETKFGLDGIKYHVLFEGDPSRPLVVLVHALMANLHMWDSTVQALHGSGYATLRFDLVGHGRTPGPSFASSAMENSGGEKGDELRYHFDDFTRHIHEMVHRFSEKNEDKVFAIVGCSMGGVLGMRYAMMYPGQVDRVMCCDAPGMTSLEASKPKWKARMDQFRAEGVDGLARATVERWFPDPCPEEVKEEALRLTTGCTYDGYEICAQGIMNYDYMDQLDKINGVKVMVLVGEKDEAIGPKEINMETAERVEGAEYMELKDCGHIPPMHRAEEFESIMVNFLNDSD